MSNGLQRREARTAGLIAGIAAATVGAIATGFELERQIIRRRLRPSVRDASEYFSLTGDPVPVTADDGTRLHAEVDEAPEAPEDALTVVFVHGYVLSRHCWYHQRQAVRGRRRVVVYDQRGHGDSDLADADSCRVDQLARDLHAVLEATTDPDEKVILVGHSMGGMTIMDFARIFPEEFERKVRGVGLVATSAGDLSNLSVVPGLPGPVFTALAPHAIAAINRAPHLWDRARRVGTDVGYVVTRRMAYGSEVPPQLVEFMVQMIGATPLKVMGDFYPAFADFDGRAGLEAIQCVESMVVGGRRDQILPVRHTHAVIERLPGAESWIDPKQGHMHFIGNPEPVNDLLDSLIVRAERAR